MHALRSRIGLVSITAGAVVFLALPVVAAGQVPGVDEVVGGVNETVESVKPPSLPAPLPTPQVQAPAPLPKPQPQQQSAPAPPPAAPAPSAPAPAPSQQRQSAPAPSGGESDAGTTSDGSSARASDAGTKKKKDRVLAQSAADERASASNDFKEKVSGVDGLMASNAPDLPPDASPETIPFTGLQLALLLLAGVAALGMGLTLRRSVRGARP